MPIRAVTFDFWGTLYDEVGDSSSRREGLRYRHALTFFAMLGVEPNQDKLRDVLANTYNHAMRLWREQHRTMDRGELGSHVARQMGYDLEDKAADALGEALAMAGVQEPPAIRVGVSGVLERLKDRYRIGLISDTCMTLGCALREVLRADQVLDYFDHLTFSDETGTAKPEMRQFLYTCHMLGAAPEETIHIGDLEETDITGAHAAGLHSVLLSNGRAVTDTRASAVIHAIEEFADLVDGWEEAA